MRNGYLVTPFWDDIDISGGGGSVYYQVFTSGNGSDSTNVNTVNAYINSVHGDSNFTGTWMLLVKWDHVSPYPHGSFQSPIFFPDIYEVTLHFDFNKVSMKLNLYCAGNIFN